MSNQTIKKGNYDKQVGEKGSFDLSVLVAINTYAKIAGNYMKMNDYILERIFLMF